MINLCVHAKMRNGAVAGQVERGLVRIGFQPGDELLEVLDLGRDGRADENTELEPRELADRNEILGRCRSKGCILIGSGTGRNSLHSARESRRLTAMNFMP